MKDHQDFGFYLPPCLGNELPSPTTCCDMKEALHRANVDDLAGHRKVFIAGAMKAGSSFLYKKLVIESMLGVSVKCIPPQNFTPKEPHFFS